MNRVKCMVLVFLIAVTGAAIAANNFIYSQPVPITGTYTMSVTNITVKPFYFTSVLLNMPKGGSNTFSVAYIRANITNELLSVSATNMTDLVWYVPGRVYFRYGDVLKFKNTSANTGTLTLNAEF